MKKSIKLFAVVLLAVCLAPSALVSCKKEKPATVGALSYLNMSEEKFKEMRNAVFGIDKVLYDMGYVTVTYPELLPERTNLTYRYFDTLDSMVMALKSGEISSITGLSQTTAEYICAKDPDLVMPYSYNWKKAREDNAFATISFMRVCDGFAFMMLKEKTELRDQFNAAIAELQNDGTLLKLIQGHILDLMDGNEPEVIVPEYKSGRETIRVAVTGDLPPMDYVSANGTFAGFNTALLAEIGKKLDRNITLVQVSSVGRATALASGTVDVAFWTRGSAVGETSVTSSSEEFYHNMDSFINSASEEELKAQEALTVALTGSTGLEARAVGHIKDMPKDTIATEPYFLDMPVNVVVKK